MPFSPEQLPPSERLEAILSLRSQYEAQLAILNQSGVLQLLPERGDVGIVGLDPEHPDRAREYPVPSFEAISEAVREQAEELETKTGQGFNKLLLVPVAQPLDKLKQMYGDLLLAHHQRGQLFNSEGKPQDLDTSEPVWAWDQYKNADIEGKLVYYPKSFESQHRGITKQELLTETLNSPFPGWEVKLVEDLPNLPARGDGETIGGRKQVEAGNSPREYLKQPQTDSQYQNEDGFTPDDWLTEAIVHLEATNQVLDDWQGKGKISYLTGSYFPASDEVPLAYFRRDSRRAYLAGDNPGYRYGDYSVRRSVRVRKRR